MQEYAKGAGKGLKARGGFKGGAKCLTSLLEAHKKRRGRPASCREEEEGKAAGSRPKALGRVCSRGGGFEGGAKCLTSLLEAHRSTGCTFQGSLPRLPPEAGKAAMQE